MEDIKKIAYEKYRLDWMIQHGCGLKDITLPLIEIEKDNPGLDIVGLIKIWEDDYGFNGELWVCYDEFIETEFLLAPYMKSLLNVDEYTLYLKEITSLGV